MEEKLKSKMILFSVWKNESLIQKEIKRDKERVLEIISHFAI